MYFYQLRLYTYVFRLNANDKLCNMITNDNEIRFITYSKYVLGIWVCFLISILAIIKLLESNPSYVWKFDLGVSMIFSLLI